MSKAAGRATGLVLGRTLKARAGLCGARGIEGDPERLGEAGRLRQPLRLVALELFEQSRLGARQPLPLRHEHETLQMDFCDADLMRQTDKSRQLINRFLEPGEP